MANFLTIDHPAFGKGWLVDGFADYQDFELVEIKSYQQECRVYDFFNNFIGSDKPSKR